MRLLILRARLYRRPHSLFAYLAATNLGLVFWRLSAHWKNREATE